MLERSVLCTKDNMNLLAALHMLVHAWNQVTATTVAHCFRDSSFCVADESPGTELACKPNQREAEVIPAGLRDALEDVSFDDYVDADSSAVVCSTITEDDVIAQVTSEEEPVVDVDESDEEDYESASLGLLVEHYKKIEALGHRDF